MSNIEVVFNEESDYCPLYSILVDGKTQFTRRTKEQILEDCIRNGYKNTVFLTLEECEIRLEQWERKRFYKPYEEINEEKYYEMAYELPPFRFERINGSTIFRFAEATYGIWRNVYIYKTGKYYTAIRPDTMSSEEIISELIKQLEEI